MISEEARHLIDTTELGMWAGIAHVRRRGNRLGDIGSAIADVGAAHGYGVVEEYVGHGIGRQMHEEPQVPNYGITRQRYEVEERHGVVYRADVQHWSSSHQGRR